LATLFLRSFIPLKTFLALTNRQIGASASIACDFAPIRTHNRLKTHLKDHGFSKRVPCVFNYGFFFLDKLFIPHQYLFIHSIAKFEQHLTVQCTK
jgi:hypothetical protein